MERAFSEDEVKYNGLLEYQGLGTDADPEDAIAHTDLADWVDHVPGWRSSVEPQIDLVREIDTISADVVDPVELMLDEVAFDRYLYADSEVATNLVDKDELLKEGHDTVAELMRLLELMPKLEGRLERILAMLEPHGITIDDLM